MMERDFAQLPIYSGYFLSLSLFLNHYRDYQMYNIYLHEKLTDHTGGLYISWLYEALWSIQWFDFFK